MTDALAAQLEPAGLALLATAPAAPGDALPAGTRSIALLGPDGPAFWPVFTASPEYADGAPDPLDRWSTRVIGGIAERLGVPALFPFGGPPWHPFMTWALRSGRFFAAPVPLLVHDTHGLMASFRGALALPEPCTPSLQPSPCESCAGQPCRTACPVAALVPDGYDVPACRTHVTAPEGTACRDGCLVRRACPVGRGLRPVPQSAFHMRAFLGSDR